MQNKLIQLQFDTLLGMHTLSLRVLDLDSVHLSVIFGLKKHYELHDLRVFVRVCS